MSCMDLISKIIDTFPEKEAAYQEHINDYGELLLHVFISDEIVEPLIKLLMVHEDFSAIRNYCTLIELMWREGTADITNALDVTVLERLSDEADIWNRFGVYISNDFKKYINKTVIAENPMMWAVSPLR